MKRLGMIMMASLMVLGFTQCKKEQAPANTEPEGVRITLTVDGSNGSKVNVDPTNGGANNYASVTFEDGDIIYVGYNNAYVGTLTYGGEVGAKQFSGSVSIDSYDGEKPLHFYFLGGKGFTPTFEGNTATVNISDQTEKYPVISYAPSEQAFTGAGPYSAKLQNKCSIMKFNVTTPSHSPICITGMNNQVTVKFNDRSDNDGFSYGKADTEGIIKMRGGSGTNVEKWAIVLQQDAYTTPGAEGTAYTEDGFYEGVRPAIPEITMNQYINEDRTMAVSTPTPDGPLFTPLTLEALSDGTILVNRPKSGMQYSLNGGAKTTMSGVDTIIDVSTGDKVAFYGNGTSIIQYSSTWIGYYGSTAQIKVYGNIMSLVDEWNYATATAMPSGTASSFRSLFFRSTTLTDASGLLLPATTLNNYCYYSMFKDCSALTVGPAALPATTLTLNCYSYMFVNCTSLTTAPALPATTLADYCYTRMFENCTSLTTAPALPATTLANNCYACMFINCTSLTAAPALPATTMGDHCYVYMFDNCTSLTTAPALSATTLADYCYNGMFSNCTSLTTAPELPATTMEEHCYDGMFNGCISLTAAPALPATKLDWSCYHEMFKGCTGLTTAPALPATYLPSGSYEKMFYGCSNLNSITCFATNVNSYSYTTDWMKDVAPTGTFTKASGVEWPTGDSGIPSGWTVNTPVE